MQVSCTWLWCTPSEVSKIGVVPVHVSCTWVGTCAGVTYVAVDNAT